MRVGVKVLQDCIRMAGSIEGGLKYYVGAANMETDGGYASKVLAEYARLQRVADGRPTPQASPAPTLTNVLAVPPAPETPAVTQDKTATLALG